jgi:hypothetical protein
MPKNCEKIKPQKIRKHIADRMFREAKKPGVTIAHCQGFFGLESASVVIEPNGSAEIYNNNPKLERYDEAEHIRGLYFAEVHRKSGVLRHVVHCEPAQLQIGDKMSFEFEDGTKFKSDKIVELEHVQDNQASAEFNPNVEILYSGNPPQY